MTTARPHRFAARLARLAGETYHGPYSAQAERAAVNAIADTLGVALAGSRQPCVDILVDTLEAGGDSRGSLIWGSAKRTSALDAALVNGTASHALDYDDVCAVFGGHHSAPLVAPLLALSEQRDVSGDCLLRAYMTGVEIEVRLARALHPVHYDKGWHPTSTIGVFGAASAAACLLGLDETRLATALSIAASMSSGIKANFGSMTKPFHVGWCARSGLLAVLLAEGGYDAGQCALEDKQGFFDVYNGSGKYALEKVFDTESQQLEIEGESIGVKQFPCCASTHAAITAALQVQAHGKPRLDEIEHIAILPNGNRLAHTNKPFPRTGLEAKFSVQYVVARALVSGTVRLDHFSDDRVREPAIQQLLNKIQAEPHPDMPLAGDNLWGAEVIVRLKSGQVLSRRVANLPCRDGNYPMTADERWNKFEDCAGTRLSPAAARALYDEINGLASLTNVAAIVRLMTA